MQVQEFLKEHGLHAEPVYNRTVVEVYKGDEKQFELAGSELVGKTTEEVIKLIKTML